jgi:hypothetical protein
MCESDNKQAIVFYYCFYLLQYHYQAWFGLTTMTRNENHSEPLLYSIIILKLPRDQPYVYTTLKTAKG